MRVPTTQTLSWVPKRYAGVIQGNEGEPPLVWRCIHKHRREAAAQDCAESNMAHVQRDRACICFHPGPSGRHTADCELASTKTEA